MRGLCSTRTARCSTSRRAGPASTATFASISRTVMRHSPQSMLVAGGLDPDTRPLPFRRGARGGKHDRHRAHLVPGTLPRPGTGDDRAHRPSLSPERHHAARCRCRACAPTLDEARGSRARDGRRHQRRHGCRTRRARRARTGRSSCRMCSATIRCRSQSRRLTSCTPSPTRSAFGRSEIVVIGDNPHDLEMARSAGAGAALGVLTGNSRRDELAPLADAVLDSVCDLPAWLRQGRHPLEDRKSTSGGSFGRPKADPRAGRARSPASPASGAARSREEARDGKLGENR